MIVRVHKCLTCRLRWSTYGPRYPDPVCPFCGSASVSSRVVER